ncbi:PTS system N-acetylglucosamine-specific IIB component, Glc family /PTS system N-acetylglucosamine-specific IIC component, Glc family [Kushneria avicenniae]|uniref:PTS system N-acetylglucosamine-specific IIB component, Glc family /PTS system N-acetylglucosamine-specific IIC component, Glc family n=1 Tax=Kushneria avicenniae TaxID=402385 RepID=A0A1I1GG93_9GAMM|nr:N-acetylglucosamine-specific PTS transporter subunit IIBC [Kushneria avicenniae]SFC10252.1 PTS system N-acetylglucosamine-specific IIB component, Glc family /PTS system N-acetylglucosamine-specific IIC component, Glc family [Kushneria avicenniae]
MRFDPMGALQQLGRSLMLPIAVLPIAGLLLRMGQPDLLDIAFIAQAGNAIFENLPLIFAIGVGVGIADDSNGAAGLAGAIGYLVITAVLEALNPDINMGVLAGIIAGVVAGLWYNRCKNIALPDYLAFFAGRRFIPIVTGLTALALGWLLGWVWPPVQAAIDQSGQWMIDSGELGLFVYGTLNRLLIVTGLHHVLNSLVWFVFGSYDGATGDLHRFFAGDPNAGSFMTGFFPVMMFGLPAAALAMYHTAAKDQRARVGGMLFSLALTAFLTGITEPLEFTFIFLAPALYAVHALLTGVSMALMSWLGVKLGFTFSAGTFDYLLSYGLSSRGWLLIPVGLLYAALYYMIFRWAIVRFDLKTPGREDVFQAPAKDDDGEVHARGPAFVTALGGGGNLTSVGACTTRLRLVVQEVEKIDEAALKGLGARGVLRLKGGHLQVVMGPIADGVAEDIRTALKARGQSIEVPDTARSMAPSVEQDMPPSSALQALDLSHWLEALGGVNNLRRSELVALSRVRLEIDDASRIDDAALSSLGAAGVQRLNEHCLHLVLGEQAWVVAQQLSGEIQRDDR